MKNKIALIHELIAAYDLTNKCRDRGLIYKRAYLYHELRTSGFSLSQIGEIFGKHHATIIHGITQSKLFGRAKDEMYLIDTKDLFEEFNNKKIELKERNLIQDIMESKNLYDLTKIKKRLQNNVYKFLDKNEIN